MRIKKLLSLAGLIAVLSLSACSMSFSGNNSTDSNEISYVPYDNKAYNTDDILGFINNAIDEGKTSCEIFVRDEKLIDANAWLKSISGVEQLQCEYRRAKDGFNIVVTFECWDNFAIMNAYNSKDTSQLNERQLILYEKYLEVLSNVTSPDKSDYENELAIHDYLVENVTYVDNDNSSSYNAYNALITGEAVCSGYTECFKTFMDMLGIENYTLSGIAGNQQHIWNVVKLGNDWYQVDVTWDDPVNSTSEYTDHSYFNITDEDMALDHSWDQAANNHPKAEGTQYSYVNMSKILSFSSQEELNNYVAGCIWNRQEKIEFTTTAELSIKDAVSSANVWLSYSYKTAKRNDYTLYLVSFTY